MPAASTIIDELFVKLGFVPDTSGIDAFKAKAEEATSMLMRLGGAITVALGAIATKAVAEVGSTFEQNQIQIAGFLNALGISSDFNAGLEQANKTIQSITTAAALLPGEADEYIEVFKSGLPFVQGALPGGSLDDITDFTNKLTAIGKSMKLPADLIGREISEILSPGQGNAQKRLPLFRLFLPLMQKLEGQAHLTAQSFNAMTAPQRAQLLIKTFGKLQPMLDASAESFDAMEGAVISAGKQLLRLSTVGLFKGMKEALKLISGLFFKADGSITDLGKKVTETGERFSRWIIQLVREGAGLLQWLSRSQMLMAALKATAVLLGVSLAGMAIGEAARGVLMLVTALANLQRLLTGGLFLAIGLIAEDLYVFYTGGDSVTGLLVEKFGPAAEYAAWALGVVLAGALVWVNRQAVATAFALVRPVLPLLALGALLIYVAQKWSTWGNKAHAAIIFVGTAAAAFFLFARRAAIQTAIGFALMNLPVILLTAGLLALGAAIVYIVSRWSTFSSGTKFAIESVIAAVGALIATFGILEIGAVGAAVASAAAWVAAAAPIALVILLVAALAVGLYELVKHWDQVTDAIDRAINALFRFLHISDDITGRDHMVKAQTKFDQQTQGFGGGFKRKKDDGGDELGFLKKKGDKGSSGAPAAAGDVDLREMLGKLLGGGDAGGAGVQGLLDAITKSGGALAASPGAAGSPAPGGGLAALLATGGKPTSSAPIPGFVGAGGRGGPQTVDNRKEVHVHGGINVDVHTDDPERVGGDTAGAVVRNLQSQVNY